MPIQPNQKYNVSVGFADLIESQNGTPGIELTFECEDGTISHTIWVTEKSREYAIRDLKTLGIPPGELTSETVLSNIGVKLLGKECSITTYEEEYKGKKRLRVQWINEKRKQASGNAVSRAALLFSDTPVTVAAENGDPDDVPF